MSAARLDLDERLASIAAEGDERAKMIAEKYDLLRMHQDEDFTARRAPVLPISPLPALRRAIEAKLAQSLEIALDERMQHRPDRRAIDRLTGEQQAFRTILNDLDHMERR